LVSSLKGEAEEMLRLTSECRLSLFHAKHNADADQGGQDEDYQEWLLSLELSNQCQRRSLDRDIILKVLEAFGLA
jgi:hypothetical protein